MHNNANNQSKEIIIKKAKVQVTKIEEPPYKRPFTIVQTIDGKPAKTVQVFYPDKTTGKFTPILSPLDNEPQMMFEKIEDAIDTINLVCKGGVTEDIDIAVVPVDSCASCGWRRPSPYTTPRLLLGICPACRRRAMERIDSKEDTRRVAVYWEADPSTGHAFEYYNGTEIAPDGTKQLKTSWQPAKTFADEFEACEEMSKLDAEGVKPRGALKIVLTEECTACGKIIARTERPRKRPLCDECNPRKKNVRK